MDFSFAIPRQNKDLLDGDGGSYFVKHVYTANEIPTLLRTAQTSLQNADAFYIFDHFDTFFSIIEHAALLQISTLVRAIEILYRTTEKLGQMLQAYLKQESLDQQSDYLNLVKMVMYLLVGTVRAIDVFVKNNHSAQNATGRGGKNKKNVDENTSHYATYEAKRFEVLVQVCNFMDWQFEKLFNLSIAEENFINLLCDLAYRTLTHPSIKEHRVNDAVFLILGKAVKSYNHAMSFPVQIVQIMEREEIAVVPIARGTAFLNEHFGITTILAHLLKEFIDKINTPNASQTTSKHFSMFITEIGEVSTELTLQCLQHSQDILNLEPYNIRNSLFTLMGHVLTENFCGEDLSSEQKEIRDEMIEDLWNHMSDVNSYVRSKVLQIANELKHRDAVPLAWIIRIINAAIERLEDKTATVRKNAISLLRSYLESNPFGWKLDVDSVEKNLAMETNKMDIIRKKRAEQEESREDIEHDFEHRCMGPLKEILDRLLSDEQNGIAPQNGIDMDEDSEKRVERIRNLIKTGDFETVSRMIIYLDKGNLDARKEMPHDNQVLYFVVLLNSYLMDNYDDEVETCEGTVGFLQDNLEFANAIGSAIPKLEQMLLSTTLSDVLESIEFFKAGYMFNVTGTEHGMRLMLCLLYICAGNDKNEKGDAVIKAYHTVLFQTDCSGRAHHIKVVDNFYNFIRQMTEEEYTALELMVNKWVFTDEISVHVINVMFERFTMKIPATTPDYARCCMEMLILVSCAKPAVASSNIKLITDIITSNRIFEDPRIYVGCLKLLMNSILLTDKNNPDKTYVFYKRYDDRVVIDEIIERFRKFFFFPKLPDFELIAASFINFLYRMVTAPDVYCQDLLRNLCEKLMDISNKRSALNIDTNANGIGLSQDVPFQIPTYLTPRIIYLFGYIASKELVYLDVDVYSNIKHREDLKREKKDAKNAATALKTPARRRTVNLNESASATLKRLSNVNGPAEGQEEQDEEYMGATAEDSLAEMMIGMCENELLGSPNGCFYNIIPLVKEILSHPAKYPDQHLQQTTVITLMRCMTVSGKFCAENISFLMNILRKTQSPAMKANIIIGLADLTSRFANTIEPWIPNFYSTLDDRDQKIRLTTMRMLSYVILQAIVRVTGQISDMAICLVDENEQIKNATKEFFRQLVISKEAEFYKILPDMVSRLSSNDTPIEEEKFRAVMKFLLDLMQKDRQIETLVDKLCARFRNTFSERQWRDIAYCLSLLNHSEKSIRKLLEHLNFYKDKVQYDEIYDCFKTIVSNANKQITKPELKLLAKELETKLQECLQTNENGHNTSTANGQDGSDANDAASAVPSQRKKATRNTKKSKATKGKRKRVERYESDGDDDDDDDDEDEENIEFDEEEDDEAVENEPPRRGKAAKAVNGKGNKVIRAGRNPQRAQVSDDDDSDVMVTPRSRRRGRR